MTPTMIDRVVLRRLTTQDLPAIVGWFQDPERGGIDGQPKLDDHLPSSYG